MKKLLCALLALIMLLSLAACGSTGTTTPNVLDGNLADSSTTPDSPDVSGDSAGGAAEEEIGEWEGDYETATVQDILKYGVGSTRWDGSLPLVTDGYKLNIGLKTDYRVTSLDDNQMTYWVEENTGLDLEFTIFAGSASDIATQMNLMLTGGEPVPDIIRVNGFSEGTKSELVRYGNLVNMAGYFMTDAYYFTEALKLNYPDQAEQNRIRNMSLYRSSDAESGYVYAFPVVQNRSTLTCNTQIMINMKWLDKLGLQKPTTIDELYNVLVAFRDKDPNGNGKKDEIPMIGMTNSIGRGVDNYIVNAFIQWGVTNRIQVENGKVFTAYTEDEYREALKFMNKLINEGLLSELCVTAGQNELKSLYNPASGEDCVVGIGAGWLTTEWLEGNEAILEYEPLPPLKDAGYGRGGYGMFDTVTLNTSDLITYSCERPEIAFRLLDYMCCPEGYLRHRWGDEGGYWKWIEDTEYADKAAGNGHLGGDAKIVRTGSDADYNRHWFAVMSFVQEDVFQFYLDYENKSPSNWRNICIAQNTLLQKAAGMPEEVFDFWSFQGDEWDTYLAYDTDIYAFTSRATDEFIVGLRDPNSDTDWAEFQKELKALHMEESWIETAQASYDRQQQGIF